MKTETPLTIDALARALARTGTVAFKHAKELNTIGGEGGVGLFALALVFSELALALNAEIEDD